MTIAGLWLPILVSTAFVFFASFLVWMVLPHHRKDWQAVPDEDGFLGDLRKQGMAPGNYMFPHCSDPKQMQDPGFKAKCEAGPVGLLTLKQPGPCSMNKELLQWLLFVLVVGVVVAYMTSRTVGTVTEHQYLAVFRVAGTTAFLAYSAAVIPQGIWKGIRWSTVWKEVIDGLIYALLTAGTFGWLA
ncbi:MAG: hypothetical protein ACYTGW_09740 [Planctomycetota bacterium]|jgi:hypothetical protein